ncbi:MAG: SPOR domain-containing protein [Granulosicoccaceae bacterium]|jgi:TPR repeat protein
MKLTRHSPPRFVSGLVISLLCLLCFQTVSAGTFAEGVLAYNNREYRHALDSWLPLAEQGHVLAQTLVGSLYAYGEGIKRNDAEAAKWFERAAQAGSAQAQYNLGILYENGWGVEKDPAQARLWYQQAANQGRKDAASRYVLLGDTATKTPPPTQHPEAQQHPEHPPGTTALMPNTTIAEAVSKPAQQPAGATGAAGRDWLVEQAAHHYTLQLVASSDPQLLRDNIARLNLTGNDYAIIESRRDDKSWYALIYGSYATIGEARQAMRDLPGSLRQYQPWIRPFADIKSSPDQAGLVIAPGN